MLELPESAAIATQMSSKLCGRTINNVIAAQSPHGFAFYSGDPSAYPSLFNGKTVQAVEAVAGQIELRADDMSLLIYDGVNPRYLLPEEKRPAKHQLLLEFDDGSAMVCTVQMFGGMMAFESGTYDNKYYLTAKEKPSPFTSAFNESYFTQLVSDAPTKLSLKGLLATEQRIPGLGNGCLQDILFNAGLNPQTKLSAVSDTQLDSVYKSVKITLQEMADKGGRDTEKDFFGTSGGYKTKLSAKTWKNPCPVCAGDITRKAYMGGNVYFCARCQPLVK